MGGERLDLGGRRGGGWTWWVDGAREGAEGELELEWSPTTYLGWTRPARMETRLDEMTSLSPRADVRLTAMMSNHRNVLDSTTQISLARALSSISLYHM